MRRGRAGYSRCDFVLVVFCCLLQHGLMETSTPTPSCTDTPSGTGTRTPTRTDTPTRTSSVTGTRTRTPTRTSTGTSTGTSTPTPSTTKTRTSTSTSTATASATSSASTSSWGSASASPITTTSTSPLGTESAIPSSSVTVSHSGSTKPSASIFTTVSSSPCASASTSSQFTRSATLCSTQSPSKSTLSSGSSSPSQTASESVTATVSPSKSTLSSGSTGSSQTVSGDATTTARASSSQSPSKLASRSSRFSRSQSVTKSPARSATHSSTRAPPTTLSPSMSASPSDSASSSASPSVSALQSASFPSVSSTGSFSPSPSASSSPSLSPSPSVTNSAAVSQSTVATMSSSASPSASGLGSGSTTPSPTATHTFVPCRFSADGQVEVKVFTDSALGVCWDPTTNCGWGSGSSCVDCPKGAVCPGGELICPRAGFWLPSSSSNPSTIVECLGDDALVRCPSYANATMPCVAADAFACGTGYLTGSVGCAGCAPGYYPSSGSCALCPETSLFRDVILPVSTILLIGCAVVGIFTGISLYCSRKYGGTLRSSLVRSGQLLVWMLTALQMLITIGRNVPENAPAIVTKLFSGLSKLQFQGVVLNQACTPGLVPFSAQWAQYATIGLSYVLAAVASAVQLGRVCSGTPPFPSESHKTPLCERCVVVPLFAVTRVALATLCVCYALFTTSALGMLTCRETSGTVGRYLALTQDGTSLIAAAAAGGIPGELGALARDPAAALAYVDRLTAIVLGASDARGVLNSTQVLSASLSVSVLSGDPFTVCREGAHAAVWAASWVVIVAFSILFPIASAVGVWAAVDGRLRDERVVAPEAVAQWLTLRAAWMVDRVRCASAARPRCCGAPCAPRVQVEREAAAHAFVDASPVSSEGGARSLDSPWTVGGPRPSHYYFMQVNQAVVFAISVPALVYVQATGSFQSGVGAQAGGLVVTLAATLGATALLWRTQPYPTAYVWKAGAGMYIYVLVAASSVSNFVGWLNENTPNPSPALRSAATSLSLIVVAATMLLFLVLIAAFLLSLRVEAKAEELRLHVADVKQRVERSRKRTASTGRLVEALCADSPRPPETYGGGLDDTASAEQVRARALRSLSAAIGSRATVSLASEPLAPTAPRPSTLHGAAHAITQGLFKLGLLAEDDVVAGSAPPTVSNAAADATTAEQVVVTNPLPPDGISAPPLLLSSRRVAALARLRPQGSSAGSARELSRATAARRELSAFRSMDARAMRSLHSRSSQLRGGSSAALHSVSASPRSLAPRDEFQEPLSASEREEFPSSPDEEEVAVPPLPPLALHARALVGILGRQTRVNPSLGGGVSGLLAPPSSRLLDTTACNEMLLSTMHVLSTTRAAPMWAAPAALAPPASFGWASSWQQGNPWPPPALNDGDAALHSAPFPNPGP